MSNKSFPSGRDLFKKHAWIIRAVCVFFSIFPRWLNLFLWSAFSRKRGKVGMLLRYALLKNLVISCGYNVAVYADVHIMGFENIRIGSNVSIHPMAYIEGSGGLEIGDNVSIAHSASIISTSHTYSDERIPIKYQPIARKKISIGDNVWVGAKASLLYGVKIGGGSIIAAHSLVNKSVPENCVVAGVPAKILKKRI